MDKFAEGWFTEIAALNSQQTNISIKVDQVIYHQRSQFQDILLFDSQMFGRVLVLDGAIQCTEKDEFSYQEMISFLPLNCHDKPSKVLIIGGGDGGVVREVVKHPLVESVVQCEIDEQVVKVAKEYLPFMSQAFDSQKLDLHFEDGYEYVKKHANEFDVIITDSSDPIGPATCLFQEPYYRALYDALKPGGIICCQAESYWFDLSFIQGLHSICKSIFQSVSYASTQVPSYPSGQIGFLLCCKDKSVDFSDPTHVFDDQKVKELGLRYYSAKMHKNAFTLPPFIAKELNAA